MDIATFGPSTGWVGKKITYADGRFELEDFGQISLDSVVDYDQQGHLAWAYVGLRDWAYQLAGRPAPVPQAQPVETASAVAPPAIPVVTPAPMPPVTPLSVTAVTVAVAAPQPPEPPAPAVAVPFAPQPPVALQPPTSPPPTGPPVAVAAAPPTPPKSSGGRLGWIIAGVVVVVLLLVGIILAGGRLRDGLGIALTLLAVVSLVVLVVAALRPTSAGRWFAGLSGRSLLIACGALAAGCFVLAVFSWWMPHYEVVAPSDKRIALDSTPEMKLLVVNRGLFGGTFKGDYSVDGVRQESVDIPLGAGEGREVTLTLPSGVERGDTLISLGGAGITAKAVAPPVFAVAPMQLDPAVAKLGDNVTLQTTVENTGDIAGTFDGVLTVNGQELLTQPVEVGAGQTKAVSYALTADKAGDYRLQLGDAGVRFAVVKPVRLSNGYVIKRSASGGRAYMTVTNATGEDAMVVLTRSGDTRRPVLVTFVRKGAKARINGIPDGKYVLWECCGTDWNWEMRDFYDTVEYKRWLAPLKFDTTASTRSWTSYWSSSAYNYSQKHSQTTTHWTNWTLTIAAGPSKYSKVVTMEAFPEL